MPAIANITGQQYVEGEAGYKNHKYQYATSSHESEGRMSPEVVIYAKGIDDIKLAIKYAKDKKAAVAVRTGGHQYSGASSCDAPNIQLDLSKTFRDRGDRTIIAASDATNGETWLRTSISWSLGEFNKYLKDNELFVPHGQCTHVHLGGHVQTGGYGQLGRSFGLLGDHVRILTIVDSDGNVRDIAKNNNPELFYALLGGSPGNLGVVTHVTIQVYNDKDYQGALGLKAMWFYNKDEVKRLMDILVEMSDDDDFPRNYDLCVSVLSSSFKLTDLFPNVDGMMRLKHPEIFGKEGMPFWPRSIVVYAQYVPLSRDDRPNMDWFRRLETGSFFTLGIQTKPMSKMTGDWIFRNIREYNHPYNKRTYLTNSHTLGRNGWSQYITDRIDAIVEPDHNDCYLSCQIQNFGGKNSMFYQNRDNGTSYSWRDTSILCVLDAFYGPLGEENAAEWQQENDRGMVGPASKFSKQDKRVLWASYGDFDLDRARKFYYEDEDKYKKIGKARQAADPYEVFTPNTFAVKRVVPVTAQGNDTKSKL